MACPGVNAYIDMGNNHGFSHLSKRLQEGSEMIWPEVNRIDHPQMRVIGFIYHIHQLITQLILNFMLGIFKLLNTYVYDIRTNQNHSL